MRPDGCGVERLERTRAFDRKLLVIVPTTGTGWVNPVAARALELMYNGDTAMVGVQYSYLPSWISFLGDQQKSLESGRMLIDAVHAAGRTTAGPRTEAGAVRREPRSMAGQAAFGYLPESPDGFLLGAVGGPTEREPAVGRAGQSPRSGHPGGPPRYDDGRTVRFSQGRQRGDRRRYRRAVGGHQGAVPAARIGSDRVVVPDLLFTRPDWLRTAGARPHGVHAVVPVRDVLTGGRRHDQCGRLPGGHGHNYGYSVLDGWAAVAPPDGWTPRTPTASGERWRRPPPKTAPSSDARPHDAGRALAWRRRWSAGVRCGPGDSRRRHPRCRRHW